MFNFNELAVWDQDNQGQRDRPYEPQFQQPVIGNGRLPAIHSEPGADVKVRTMEDWHEKSQVQDVLYDVLETDRQV